MSLARAAFGSFDRQRGSSLGDGLCKEIRALRPKLAAAAQSVYDGWEQDAEGIDCEVGAGGICDEVTRAMMDVVAGSVVDAEVDEGGQDGDDHSWLLVSRGNERCFVDIPPSVYERGSGYRWTKRPGAQITADDVIVEPLDD